MNHIYYRDNNKKMSRKPSFNIEKGRMKKQKDENEERNEEYIKSLIKKDLEFKGHN